MGLFSSKKKHFVDSSVVRVIEDELLPDTLRRSVVEALFLNQPISGQTMTNVLGGSWLGIERAYRFARSGQYTFGTPDALIYSSAVDPEDVRQDIVDSDPDVTDGEQISIEYVNYRPINNFFVAWKRLYEEEDYDPETNSLKGSWLDLPEPPEPPPGEEEEEEEPPTTRDLFNNLLDVVNGVKPVVKDRQRWEPVTVWLEKIVAYHDSVPGQEVELSATRSPESTSTTGPVPELSWDAREETNYFEEVVVGTNITEGYEIFTAYIDYDGNTVRESQFFSMEDEYDEDQEYYQAKYTLVVDGERVTRFWIYQPPTRPWDVQLEPGERESLDNRYQTPTEIENGEYFPFVVVRQDNENRGAERFQETSQYISTQKLCKKMGFDFQDLVDAIHSEENEDGVDNVRQAVMTMAVPITTEDERQVNYLFAYFKDLIEQIGPRGNESYAVEFTDADFSLYVSFDGIANRYRLGSIGEVGSVENTQTELSTEPEAALVNFTFTGGATVSGSRRYIRRQVTTDVYEEIAIDNPQFRYKVFEDKGVEGGIDDERLLIPVNMRIAKDAFNVIDREYFYAISLNLVFNSHVVQKVKWYERGVFKIIIIVIAVVISLWDGGLTLTTIMSALAAGGAAAVAVTAAIIGTIIQVVVVGRLIELGLEKVADILGAEIAAVLAAIALTYGVMGKTFSIGQGRWLLQAKPMDLINIASNLIEKAVTVEMDDILSEWADFEDYKEEKLELLEDAQELLGNPLDINPLLFVYREPLFVPGETAGDFYSRTVENKNPGAQSLDFIQNFYDVSLRLPTIS